MILKINKEYPCGYKIDIWYEGWNYKKAEIEETICPIHGRKCKKTTK